MNVNIPKTPRKIGYSGFFFLGGAGGGELEELVEYTDCMLVYSLCFPASIMETLLMVFYVVVKVGEVNEIII